MVSWRDEPNVISQANQTARLEAQLPRTLRGKLSFQRRSDPYGLRVLVRATTRHPDYKPSTRAVHPEKVTYVEFWTDAPEFKIPEDKLALMCVVL